MRLACPPGNCQISGVPAVPGMRPARYAPMRSASSASPGRTGMTSGSGGVRAGAVIAASETWLIVRLIDDNNELDRLEAEVDAARESGDVDAENAAVAAFNDRLDTFVANQWFLGGLLAYSLLDAYVDAHFRDFDIEFGPEAPPQGGSSKESGMRIGLRWSF